MDTTRQISQYERLIVDFLTSQRTYPTTEEGYRKEIVTDRDHRHYQLLATGWLSESRYVNTILIHLQIKSDGKVWLLENNTELHVAEELIRQGVTRTDIVLGFHPAAYRALSDYAAA